MPPTRSNLKLDEESFENLLAAAYTVQEHNAKQKRAGELACSKCGNGLELEHQFCPRCGAQRDEFRPGERMQRNWASLWMMSQRQSGDSLRESRPSISDRPRIVMVDRSASDGFDGNLALQAQSVAEDEPDPAAPESLVLAGDEDVIGEAEQFEEPESSEPASIVLRFRREDLYLAIAILVSTFALMWVIWAAPVTRSWEEKARLTVWQRTLVKLGVAEAPSPPVVYRGDPEVKVWADPHTALYYCYGEDQYGKTADGHFSTQREAQMDRFSPAARAPCE